MTYETFPCLVCGRVLYREMDEYEAQPRDGVMCSSSGNYGSTVFDPMNGEHLQFNICDRCIESCAEFGRVYIRQASIPVTCESVVHLDPPRIMRGIVGARAVDRPYVPWRRGLPACDETEDLTIEEVFARLDNDNYRWNLDRAGFEFMRNELAAYDDETEAGSDEHDPRQAR